MKPSSIILEHLKHVSWLSTCGQSHAKLDETRFQSALSQNEALVSFNSDSWVDAKTNAFGDITEYLAAKDYDFYSSNFNKCSIDAMNFVRINVQFNIKHQLEMRALPLELSDVIARDLVPIIVEFTFGQKFPHLPIRFRLLFDAYLAGRLPCGWSNYSSDWSTGRLLYW